MIKQTLTWLVVAVLNCHFIFAQTLLSPANIKPTPATRAEIRWGKAFGKQMVKEQWRDLNVLDDPQLQDYVDFLLETTLINSPAYYGKLNYSIRVSKNPGLGAISFSNGEIFISLYLLCDVDYEDVLIQILGHEVSHVALRDMIGKFQITTKQSVALRKLIFVGGNNYAAINLQQQQQKLLISYVQNQEIRVDVMSVKIMMSAGYDPEQVIAHMLKAPDFIDGDEEHPSAKVRVERIRAESAYWKQQWPWWQPLAHVRPEFLAKKCVAYGLF